MLRLERDSPLVGKSLAESRLGAAVGLNVLGILRDDETHLAPEPSTRFKDGDGLLVSGQMEQLQRLVGQQHIVVESTNLTTDDVVSSHIQFAEVGLSPRSALIGKTLEEIDFRRRFGLIVLAIWRDGKAERRNRAAVPLRPDDTLLVQGPRAQIDTLRDAPRFSRLRSPKLPRYSACMIRLMVVRVPQDSLLTNRTIAASRLSEAFGLAALGIIRGDETLLMPGPDEQILAGRYVVGRRGIGGRVHAAWPSRSGY